MFVSEPNLPGYCHTGWPNNQLLYWPDLNNLNPPKKSKKYPPQEIISVSGRWRACAMGKWAPPLANAIFGIGVYLLVLYTVFIGWKLFDQQNSSLCMVDEYVGKEITTLDPHESLSVCILFSGWISFFLFIYQIYFLDNSDCGLGTEVQKVTIEHLTEKLVRT